MSILLTGGAGYIGSHTCLQLLKSNYDVIVLDNCINSSFESIRRIQNLLGKTVKCILGDLTNLDDLNSIFQSNEIDAVIHFAGLKSVSESVLNPLKYFNNNVIGTLNLIKAMEGNKIYKLVFSSSATVYGNLAKSPCSESDYLGICTNPYGNSKAIIEKMLSDLSRSNPEWSITSLRYFNPVGADRCGLIGESPKASQNNLMPYLLEAASEKNKMFFIYGGDYETIDGTCQRDFVHVNDLALGHLAALNFSNKGFHTFNLGAGKPVSVLQMVNNFKTYLNIEIPFQIVSRREGDLPDVWANISKAERILNWRPKYTMKDIIEDSWRWKMLNPNGYQN